MSLSRRTAVLRYSDSKRLLVRFGQLAYVKRLEFGEDKVEDALVGRLLADSRGGVFAGIVQQNQTSRVFAHVLRHVVHLASKQYPRVRFDVVSLELLQGNRCAHWRRRDSACSQRNNLQSQLLCV